MNLPASIFCMFHDSPSDRFIPATVTGGLCSLSGTGLLIQEFGDHSMTLPDLERRQIRAIDAIESLRVFLPLRPLRLLYL